MFDLIRQVGLKLDIVLMPNSILFGLMLLKELCIKISVLDTFWYLELEGRYNG